MVKNLYQLDKSNVTGDIEFEIKYKNKLIKYSKK